LNLEFDNHREASLLRDSGDEVGEKTMQKVNVAIEDEIVDIPAGHTLELDCEMITASRYFHGKLYLSATGVAFEARETTDAFGDPVDKTSKLIEILLDSISFVLKRRYLHIDCPCEVFIILKRSRFFIFFKPKFEK
jgi:hypothetical protein